MEKHKLSRRHTTLVRLLIDHSDGMTIRTLAKRLGVTQRTIRRDLATLKSENYQIHEQTGPHGIKYWYLTGEKQKMSALTYDEAAALVLGLRLLEPLYGSILWNAAESAKKKIVSRLDAQAFQYFKKLTSVFHLNPVTNIEPGNEDIIDTLINACEENGQVILHYLSASSNNEEKVIVWPQSLVISKGVLYLNTSSDRIKGDRSWRVDQIRSAQRIC